MSGRMFDIIRYCQNVQREQANANVKTKRLVSSGNDPSISTKLRYSSYVVHATPKPIQVANIMNDPSNNQLYLGLAFGTGIRTI